MKIVLLFLFSPAVAAFVRPSCRPLLAQCRSTAPSDGVLGKSSEFSSPRDDFAAWMKQEKQNHWEERQRILKRQREAGYPPLQEVEAEIQPSAKKFGIEESSKLHNEGILAYMAKNLAESRGQDPYKETYKGYVDPDTKFMSKEEKQKAWETKQRILKRQRELGRYISEAEAEAEMQQSAKTSMF